MKIQPETMLADEDDVSFAARKIPGPPGHIAITEHEYSLLQLYETYLKLQHNEYKGEYAQYEKERDREYFEKIKDLYIKHVSEFFGDLHPKLKDRLKQVVDAGFYITLNRAASHVTKVMRTWDLPEVVKKYGTPDPSKAEKDYKRYESQLTRTLKSIARKENSFRQTARLEHPVRYKGANKIVCIIREHPDYALEVVYGKPPEEFIKDWKERVGEIEWYK